MNCPWADWRPTRFFFCETPLCSWIQEPFNSVSNVFYLVAAVFIWLRWRSTHPKLAKRLVLNLSLIALGSFFLHASKTFAGEVADMAGMFFLIATILVWNLTRYKGRTLRGETYWFLCLGLIPSTALLFSALNGNLIFLGLMGCVGVTEWIQLQNPKKTRYFWGVCAAASFLVGLPFWWFEAGQPWCSPDTHGFTGHVVWHFLTTVSVVLMAEYYSQFGFLSD